MFILLINYNIILVKNIIFNFFFNFIIYLIVKYNNRINTLVRTKDDEYQTIFEETKKVCFQSAQNEN